MQIKIRNTSASPEDVSALELPLRLSAQLVSELQILDSEIDCDYLNALQKLRNVRDIIMSMSISVQRIHDGIVSDLVISCKRLQSQLSFEHSDYKGESTSPNTSQLLE